MKCLLFDWPMHVLEYPHRTGSRHLSWSVSGDLTSSISASQIWLVSDMWRYNNTSHNHWFGELLFQIIVILAKDCFYTTTADWALKIRYSGSLCHLSLGISGSWGSSTLSCRFHNGQRSSVRWSRTPQNRLYSR